MKGIGASEGICIGKIYKYEAAEPVINKVEVSDVAAEIGRFEASIEESKKDIAAIKEKTAATVDEETAAIFGAHLEILGDPELIGGVKSMIENDSVNADFALKSVSDQFIAIFEAMDNEYIRERAADIKDVSMRMLKHMQGLDVNGLEAIDEPVIVLAKDLTPSDTAQLNRDFVLGFITDIGGRTSHSAIMARTLEIPAVVGTNDAYSVIEDGANVLMDGSEGLVIVNPSEEEVSDYKLKMEKMAEDKAKWLTYLAKESVTADGRHFEIAANIGQPEDGDGAVANGADGIGLYRTEFLYMGKNSFPTEDEQYEAYKTVLEKMNGKPVVIRTLDIGGDKELDYFETPDELNPFLGNRAVRLCMSNQAIFKTQLRALLRASVHGNLHIMFPMIATIDEFRSVRGLLEEVKVELVASGVAVSEDYKTGIMIEIPAAALAADIFAKEVDFFSIGTNDLIQYTFAADRMNEQVSYLYQPFNPSLLRLIKMVADAAHREGKWVGMCGEMAGEAAALPLLLGLGLDELSMSAPSVLRTRYTASMISSVDAKSLADKALGCENQAQVKALVDDYLAKLLA